MVSCMLDLFPYHLISIGWKNSNLHLRDVVGDQLSFSQHQLTHFVVICCKDNVDKLYESERKRFPLAFE